MADDVTYGDGTPDDPWVLQTPSQILELHGLARRVGAAARPRGAGRHHDVVATTCSAVDDLAAMLRERGDWVPLGNADEGKPVKDGTVEAWARSDDNPVGGYYGLRKGYRGRFANYVTAGARAARPGRAGARCPQQPGARHLAFGHDLLDRRPRR